MRETLPTVYTARYLTGRLPDEGLVPVRVSMREPVVPLSYDLEETARTLVPKELLIRRVRGLHAGNPKARATTSFLADVSRLSPLVYVRL